MSSPKRCCPCPCGCYLKLAYFLAASPTGEKLPAKCKNTKSIPNPSYGSRVTRHPLVSRQPTSSRAEKTSCATARRRPANKLDLTSVKAFNTAERLLLEAELVCRRPFAFHSLINPLSGDL